MVNDLRQKIHSKVLDDQKEVLDRLYHRNEVAFIAVYLEIHASLCFFANKLLTRLEDGKDLVDDVFLKYWERPRSFNTINHLKAFFYCAVRNACLDHLRTTKRRTIRHQRMVSMLRETCLSAIMQAEMRAELHYSTSSLSTQAEKTIQDMHVESKFNHAVADGKTLSVQTTDDQKQRPLPITRTKIFARILRHL